VRNLSILFVMLSIASCNEKQAAPTLQQKEKFGNVYSDYLIIATADTAKAVERKSYFDSALIRQNMSERDFLFVLEYYKNHPEELERILMKADARLQPLQKQAARPKPK
jgi:hypothetical protein